MITPEVAFTVRNLYVFHFRIFGSMVYFHVSSDWKKNLEPSVERGVFVGYFETPHIYQVYMSSLKMNFMRRDMIFYDSKAMRSYLE